MKDYKYYKLTNPQKTILLTEQYYKNTAINNIISRIIFKENMNIDLLIKALKIIVKQNDAFRIKIIKQNNEYLQYFEDYSEDFKIEIIEINENDNVNKIIKELSKKPIQVLNDNLFKIYILKYSNGYAEILTILHHIIADAWGLTLYVNEIIRIYKLLLDENENIENINYSYINYIDEEKEYLSSEKIIDDKNYWNNEYNNEIATKFFQTSASIKGKRECFVIDNKTTNEIKEYCKNNKISEQCLFMSVLAIYLSKISSNYNISIGMPILNRRNYKDKNTIGMFIETLPFCININSEMNCKCFLKYITEKQYSLLKHHKYPYEEIQKNIKEKLGINDKLYSVAFSYQNAVINSNEINIDAIWEYNGYCPDDLQVHINDRLSTNTYNICYDYKVNGIEKEEIKKIHKRLLNIINQIIKNDEKTIKEIEIITDEEKELIGSFNNTYIKFNEKDSVYGIIEKISDKYKDRIAIVDYHKTITYAELKEKTNILSNYLTKNRHIKE